MTHLAHRSLWIAALITALIAPLIATPAPAQNVITNGDFSILDPSGNPVGWQLNFDLAPAVVKFDTAGLGSDACFSVVHGKGTATSTGIGDLQQGPLLVVQGLTYELRADVAVGGSFNNDPGKFEFFLDGVSVATVDFTTARGPKPLNEVFRERVCVQFTATTTNPTATFKIEISRTFQASSNRTPTAYLDNVFLGEATGPQMCLTGERKAGTQVQLDVLGRPSTPFAFFAAAGLLPAPVTIPGWTGQLEIKSPALLLLIGSTNASGKLTLQLNTPPGAAQIYVQGGQTGLIGAIDLGYSQLLNLY